MFFALKNKYVLLVADKPKQTLQNRWEKSLCLQVALKHPKFNVTEPRFDDSFGNKPSHNNHQLRF